MNSPDQIPIKTVCKEVDCFRFCCVFSEIEEERYGFEKKQYEICPKLDEQSGDCRQHGVMPTCNSFNCESNIGPLVTIICKLFDLDLRRSEEEKIASCEFFVAVRSAVGSIEVKSQPAWKKWMKAPNKRPSVKIVA